MSVIIRCHGISCLHMTNNLTLHKTFLKSRVKYMYICTNIFR